MLKKEVGQLIRSGSDRSVVARLDPRVLSKCCGRRIHAALLPMPHTDGVDTVRGLVAGDSEG